MLLCLTITKDNSNDYNDVVIISVIDLCMHLVIKDGFVCFGECSVFLGVVWSGVCVWKFCLIGINV